MTREDKQIVDGLIASTAWNKVIDTLEENKM